MWNPPVVDEALQTRRSALGEAADSSPSSCGRGRGRSASSSRARRSSWWRGSRRARLRDDAEPELADRVAPYRAGYTPQQRRELEARLDDGDLLAVITTDALELGHRHRRARRGGRRDVPGHGRVAAADVGPRGASRARPGGLRRRRGRARPVLLPPSRRVPRAAGRGGDPRPRERADPPRAPALRGARGPAGRRTTPRSSGRAGRPHARGLVRRASCVERARALPAAPPEDYPAARVSLRSAAPDSFAVVDVASRRAARQVEAARAYSTVHEGAVYLHLGRSYEVARARPRRRGARSSARSTATGTRSPRRRR